MLAIVNVTPEDSSQPLDSYEIRINQRVIGKFEHKRAYRGASDCLRCAADALDKSYLDEDVKNLLELSLSKDFEQNFDKFLGTIDKFRFKNYYRPNKAIEGLYND